MGGESLEKPRLLSPAKAGAELGGISRQRVNKLVERWPQVKVDGLIDIEALRQLRSANLDPGKAAAYEQAQRRLAANAEPATRPAPPSRSFRAVEAKSPDEDPEEEQPELDFNTFNGAKTARERANARLAEIKLAEAEGRLIDREQVIATNFAIARKLRDRINGFPTRLQQFMPPEAMQMLVDECAKLVDELQADAAKIAEDGI
jgi:hypothetical protein